MGLNVPGKFGGNAAYVVTVFWYSRSYKIDNNENILGIIYNKVFEKVSKRQLVCVIIVGKVPIVGSNNKWVGSDHPEEW